MGAGAILPGVSGGVLCAAFGLYMPLMKLLSHPKREIPKTYKMWLAVGIGWICGFVLFAVAVMSLLDFAGGTAEALFSGLIIGTFPALYREAHNNPDKSTVKSVGKGRKALRWGLLGIGFAATLLSMTAITYLDGRATLFSAPSLVRFLVCGIILGLGMIIPGVTSSSFLMMLGLYEPMTDGIATFDFSVILPTFLGVGMAFVLAAKLINALFDKFYTEAYFTVMGIVAASALLIIPRRFDSILMLVICVVLFFGGVVVSYVADKKLGGKEGK
jgi:putative membrane protein